MNLVLECNF